MGPVPDYGSTLGALIFAQEVAVLFYLFPQVRLNTVRVGAAAAIQLASGDEDDDATDDRLDADTRFLFDVVARRNEGFIQNIDALDNGLIAVTVATIAVTLFAADKWSDLDPSFRFTGLVFLIESAAIALFGYVTMCLGRGTIDDVGLRDFVKDFSQSASDATTLAITDIIRSAESNAVARRFKRTFIILATALAIIGVAVLVAGRALAPLHH